LRKNIQNFVSIKEVFLTEKSVKMLEKKKENFINLEGKNQKFDKLSYKIVENQLVVLEKS
jgi:hypothetical protein